MTISLGQQGEIFIPEVPATSRQKDSKMYEWCQMTKRAVEGGIRGLFANDSQIATVVNSGTTGSFVIGTSTLSISNGVITSVS